jgi:hypothetical protein
MPFDLRINHEPQMNLKAILFLITGLVVALSGPCLAQTPTPCNQHWFIPYFATEDAAWSFRDPEFVDPQPCFVRNHRIKTIKLDQYLYKYEDKLHFQIDKQFDEQGFLTGEKRFKMYGKKRSFWDEGLLKQQAPLKWATVAGKEELPQTYYTYSESGLLLENIDAERGDLGNRYDYEGERLVRMTDIGYGIPNRLEFDYADDQLSGIRETAEEPRHVFEYEIENGRILIARNMGKPSQPQRERERNEFTYDKAGRVIQIVSYTSRNKDEAISSMRISFSYDKSGLLSGCKIEERKDDGKLQLEKEFKIAYEFYE